MTQSRFPATLRPPMNSNNPSPDPAKRPLDRETTLLLGGFFLTGVISVLLGPLIPELEERWGIDHGQSGSLFLMQFAASSIGAILSSFNLRRSIICGYLLSAVSLVGVVLGGWVMARPFMALLGFSLGLLISGSNLFVARRNPGRRGAALATLNLMWGIGAVVCPLLFAAAGPSGPVGAFGLLAILAGLSALAGLLLAGSLRPADHGAGPAASAPPEAPPPLGLLLLVAGLLFLYVGVETSVGGWLVALADQCGANNRVISLLIGSGFWGALLVGRGLASFLLRRISEATLYVASLAVGAVGTVGLLLAESRPTIAAGAILAGLGLAAVYPLTVSILAAVTASSRSKQAGWVMAFGGFGGAFLPWLAGRLSRESGEFAGELSRGFLVPTVGLVLMAVLFTAWSLSRRAPQT